MTAHTYVSVSHFMPERIRRGLTAALPVGTRVQSRSSDWGLTGTSRRLRRVGSTGRWLWQARHARTVVVVTAGLDVYAIGVVGRLLRPRVRIVAVDFLIPASTRAAWFQSWALRRVDAWGCVRSQDISTLRRRFGVDSHRGRFVPFPPGVDADGAPPPKPEGGPDRYVYASGVAHRDWPTLFRALGTVDCDAVVSIDPDDVTAETRAEAPRVVVSGRASADTGRRLAGSAAVVVVPMLPTDLPAGPSVLVDAMALGRAVVATDTPGTRDYVDDGVTGWLVPPGDADAMAAAIVGCLADDSARNRVGRAAADATRTRFSVGAFGLGICSLLDDAGA